VFPGTEPAAGFERHDEGRGMLVADARLLPELVAAGFARPERWVAAGDDRSPGAGRGATARWTTAAGRELVLKQLRRGGAVGRWWRDRHFGTGRLARNLTVPAEARRRGVATPAVVAVLAVPGPPGLWRGWLAVEALDGEDLLALLRRGIDAGAGDARRALGAVRRAHDAGLEHPDLNLGNLFIDRDGAAHVLDLDGARLRTGAVGPGRRFRELLRLERSWLRNLGPVGPEGRTLDTWIHEVYVEGDRALARGLASRRTRGAIALAARGIRRRGGQG
jgi:3-deoxy-D-manno-octulosonic acid kinase